MVVQRAHVIVVRLRVANRCVANAALDVWLYHFAHLQIVKQLRHQLLFFEHRVLLQLQPLHNVSWVKLVGLVECRAEVFEDVGEYVHVGRNVKLHILTQRKATKLKRDGLRIGLVVKDARLFTRRAVQVRTRWHL